MLGRLRAQHEDDAGFTLIELLVVIIIIGILAAIAIPVFLNQRKKGVDASIKSDLRQSANELETYFTDAQAYSTTLVNAIKVSSGNVIKVGVNATGDAYCLMGSNPKGTASGAANKFYFYDSGNGGLKGIVQGPAGAGGNCTTAPTVTFPGSN
jgi:prepilin-type N-terminal cleavage/methylation domain-containing protein